MRLFTKTAAVVAIACASVSAQAADQAFTGDGSVLLSVWQEGFTSSGGDAASVILDTGLNFSDLFTLGAGQSQSVDVDSIFDVSSFIDSNVVVSDSNPMVNIAGGAVNSGFEELFSSNDGFSGSGSNVQLGNSINVMANNITAQIPGSGVATSLTKSDDPNAAADGWSQDFGQSFTDIDNAFEISGTPNGFGGSNADGNVSGDMILFQTSAQGTLNGQPLQVNDFGGLYTFAYDLAAGTLSFTNTAAAAVPLPAAVWFLGSALVGLLGFSRRRAIAA